MGGHRFIQVFIGLVTPTDRNTASLFSIDGTIRILQIDTGHVERGILELSRLVESDLNAADGCPRHKTGQCRSSRGFCTRCEILFVHNSQHREVAGLLRIRCIT